MNRVIILEGCDGSGKSTLAKFLVERHGFKYRHEGPPKEGRDQFSHYTRQLWRALNEKQPVVFDRCYLGETVYGPIFRGKDQLGENGVRLIERVCRANDVKLVLCMPPWERVKTNFMTNHDDFVGEVGRLRQVYERYLNLDGKRRYLRFDFTYHLAYTEPWYEFMYQLFGPSKPLPAGVIGSPAARFLVVGEQVNRNVVSTDLPFYSKDGSSGYLSLALWSAGIPEHDLAFTNALRVTGDARDMASVVDSLPNLKLVIALGETATKVCKKQGVEAASLPHPSYWKRFKHFDIHDYADKFKEVCGVLQASASSGV